MKHDNWTPIPMYCSNCGKLNYGYRNEDGKIKYECDKCKVVFVRVQKGRRHDTIDMYAPVGQVRYAEKLSAHLMLFPSRKGQ